MRPAVKVLVLLVFLSCSRFTAVENQSEPVIDPLRLQAEEIANSMNDRLLAAQLLISGIDGRESLSQNMMELLTDIPAGGIMFFRYNIDANTGTIRSFLSQISDFVNDKSGIRPFMAIDHEGGSVNRLPHHLQVMPSASHYWELNNTEGKAAALAAINRDSLRDGTLLKSLGINMNFAPVAEYLMNENSSFLARRSYGPDPVFCAEAALAFLTGMQQAGVLCVVKHFPGSAGADPHYSASVINADLSRMDELAFPFDYLIKNNARSIMAAHTLVPVIDDKIASLSSVFMQNWLRDKLKFDGIIVSDDFIMAAAGRINPEDAAVLSIIAGSDMILVWPAHLRKTHDAIILALENGSLPRERLINAAQRVIYEKLRMGMIE
ncbi:MAG: glycoside hydrolase family 3 protein [Treponema sp.]|nr:glycoside hydrolase family 3 protein [Treponema sp.]